MKRLILTALLASFALPLQAAQGGSAKSIVLRTLGGEPTGMDGMQISFMIRNQDGSVMPRDHKYPFNTGHRFKVKVASTADGNLTITNIDPLGKVTPLLTQAVTRGMETVIPARGDQFFEFEGPKGDERLKFELIPVSYNPPALGLPNPLINVTPSNPTPPPGPINPALISPPPSTPYSNVSGKSIRLVTSSDGSSDYLIRPAGTGTLVQEIVIKHQ